MSSALVEHAISHPTIAKRYRLLDKLGKGGMGEVWSACDLLTNKKLALKRLALSTLKVSESTPPPDEPVTIEDTSPLTDETIEQDSTSSPTATFAGAQPTPRPTTSPSQALRLALAQEFRVLASMRHPCIISVLDYGFDDEKQPYFTMELLEEPLDMFAATRRVPAARQVSLLINVLQALVYLHRREILHRDLKPTNVLVQEGSLKVLDFGLAVKQSAVQELAGSLRYMAPEILLGRAASVASDLFSFGVMAYEVLTGAHPFPVWKTLQELAKLPKPNLESIRGLQQALKADAPMQLDAVVERLLAPNPDERYPNALSVIEDLSAAIGEPPPAETRAIRESFLQAAEFVGRESEMAEFRKALHGLQQGTGRAVLIGGESGVGKSRVVEEIRTEALVRGVLVVRGQALAEAGLAYQEWRDPVRRLCLGTDLSDDELTHLQILVPDVCELLGRNLPPAQRPPDPASLHQALLATTNALFRRQTGPVLLILEDLHWTSDDSLSLLQELNQLTWTHPLLIVGTFRNDEKPALSSLLPKAQYMNLARMQDDAIAKLSSSILGASGARRDVVEYLKQQTEGNVFFLVEVVRSLAETAGGLDMIVSEQVPERVTTPGISDIVRRRLDRIPSKWRAVMEVAAVAGRQLDLNVLEAALPEADPAEWLHAAADAMVLDLIEGEWRFSHDKVREAVLASLNASRTAELHQQVALAIEHVFAETARPAPVLAYHWAQAGNPEREQRYAALAGDQMLKSAAYSSAVKHLERALELLPYLPREHAHQELALQLNLGTTYLITRGHASPDMKRAFDRAGELCLELGDPVQLFRVLFGQSTFYLFRGELEPCRALAERCLKHAEKSGDPDMLLEAHFALGNALYWQGEFARSVEQMEQVTKQFKPHQHDLHTAQFGHNPRVTCLTYGTWATWALGYPDRALRLAQEAAGMAEEKNHAFSRAIAIQTLAFLHHQRRDVAETQRYAEILIEHAGEYRTYWLAGRFLLGWALVRQQRIAEGTEIIRDGWTQWGQAGAGLAHSLYATFLLEAALESGDLQSGIELATSALAKARQSGEGSHEAELFRLRGELHSKLGDQGKAAADFNEALKTARRQQARSYELRTLNSICRHGKDGTKRDELAATYARFSEGFETEDLKIAKQILEERK